MCCHDVIDIDNGFVIIIEMQGIGSGLFALPVSVAGVTFDEHSDRIVHVHPTPFLHPTPFVTVGSAVRRRVPLEL